MAPTPPFPCPLFPYGVGGRPMTPLSMSDPPVTEGYVDISRSLGPVLLVAVFNRHGKGGHTVG